MKFKCWCGAFEVRGVLAARVYAKHQKTHGSKTEGQKVREVRGARGK